MARDITKAEIKKHDVLRNVNTGAIVLVVDGKNKGHKGLGVVNDIAGIMDWLDVYPDGTFEILGSADNGDDEVVGAQ